MNQRHKRIVLLGVVAVLLSSIFISSLFIPKFNSNETDRDIATIKTSASQWGTSSFSIQESDDLYQDHEYTFTGLYYNDSNYAQTISSAKIEAQHTNDADLYYNESITDLQTQYNENPESTDITNGSLVSSGEWDTIDSDAYQYNSSGELGHYPATYSFTDESSGDYTSNPTDLSFIDSTSSTNSISVEDSVGNHKKVLRVEGSQIENYFTDSVKGMIEFWLRIKTTNTRTSLFLYDGGTIGIYLDFDNGNIECGNGNVEGSYSADTWFHIRIDFDCNLDTYDTYKNGNLLESGTAFYSGCNDLDKFTIYERQNDYIWYLDAIGYSWDSDYLVGDNWYHNYYNEANYTFEDLNTSSYGDYYGSYSFEDEAIDTYDSTEDSDCENELNFVDSATIPSSCEVSIENEIGGHKKVLHLKDNSDAGSPQVENEFDAQTSGSIGFWYRMDNNGNNVDAFGYILFYDSTGTMAFRLRLGYSTDNDIWSDGGTAATGVIYNNQWVLLRFDFDCSTDTFDTYADGTSESTDVNFANNVADISKILIYSEGNSNGLIPYNMYYDAIGYSWLSNYTTEDNINPYGRPSDLSEFIDEYDVDNDCEVSISGDDALQRKILRLNDDTGSGNVYVYNNFNDKSEGIIEFWTKTTDSSLFNAIRVLDDGDSIIYLKMDGGNWFDYASDSNLRSASSNTWYHIKLDFTSSHFDMWINGNKELDGQAHYGTYNDGFDQLCFVTSTGDSGYKFFIDGIDYNWSTGYYDGRNTIALLETKLNITHHFDFASLDDILQVEIFSTHRTDNSTTMNFEIYNNTLGAYQEVDAGDYTTYTNIHEWYNGSNISDLWNSSFGFKLRFNSYNYDNEFDLFIDLLRIRIYTQLHLSHDLTFHHLGLWKYRFHILANEWASSDWIWFDVIEPDPNVKMISEATHLTEWEFLSTGYTEIDVYESDFSSESWSLEGVSESNIITEEYILEDSHVYDVNPDTNYGSETSAGISKTDTYEGRAYIKQPDLTDYLYSSTDRVYLIFYIKAQSNDPSVDFGLEVYEVNNNFDENTITWNNKPSFDDYITKITLPTDDTYHWREIEMNSILHNIGFSENTTTDNDAVFLTSEEFFNNPYMQYNISKFYQDSNKFYIQTNTTETLQAESPNLNLNLEDGDKIEVSFNTTSENRIDLNLLDSSSTLKTFTLSPQDNQRFTTQTKTFTLDADYNITNLNFEGEFEDTKNLQVNDIRIYRINSTGLEETYSVDPDGFAEIYLDFPVDYEVNVYEDDLLVKEFNLSTTQYLQTLVYERIDTTPVFLTFYDSNNEYVDFNLFNVYVNYTYQEYEYVNTRLSNREFYVDEDTTISFEIYDSFNALIYKSNRTAQTFIDITLSIYTLKIKNLAQEYVNYSLSNTDTGISKNGDIFPDEIIKFHISDENYSLAYTNNEDGSDHSSAIQLTENQIFTINSTYFDIYFGLFTYDGLGIDHDLVRFYINGNRKDFGFNTIQTEATDLLVLDYFNNTLANETIDASAYDNSEYNIFVEIYTLNILNQFTYEDLVVNITQSGSGIYMNQLIPASSSLLYRFIPEVNYTIEMTYLNDTVYSIREVNLTTNNQIESFGIPTDEVEYPKEVYFGVYDSTGLGIDFDLLKLYIAGSRTNFGFNTINNEITQIQVLDYFNNSLFNSNVNFSGLDEYNIQIDLYSMKFKNDAREIINYTLYTGGSSISDYILSGEIIQYNLGSNNYTFNWTNNEDNSHHSISINLNQNRVYTLNTTYYDIYFSLYDTNLHTINIDQYEFRLNGSIQDFGLIKDLETDYYNITIQDRFNNYLFNDLIGLRGLNEYRINISLYELQIRHLATTNNQINITCNNNTFSYIASPDSLKSFYLGTENYSFSWLNNENNKISSATLNLSEDLVYTLNTSYYEVYFGLYNVYSLVKHEEVKFYINNSRSDFGFNTLRSDVVNLQVLDYFNNSLFNKDVNLRGEQEYNIYVEVYTLIIQNNYRNTSLFVNITKGNITIQEFIEPQGSIKLKLFKGTQYTIETFINDTLDEEETVLLDEDNTIVDFGFYSTEIPELSTKNITNAFLFYLIVVIIFAGIIFASLKIYRKMLPKVEAKDLLENYRTHNIKKKKQGVVDNRI